MSTQTQGLVNAAIVIGMLVSAPVAVALPVPSAAPLPSDSLAQFFSNKAVLDEVWQLVDRSYLDPTFNGQDWQAVRQQYYHQASYDSVEALYQAIRDMLELLGDPQTRFMSPEEFRAMQIDSGDAGVGLQLWADPPTNELRVRTTLEESPADAAGILPDDVLLTIDGTEVQGLTIYAAAVLLRGPVGSPVTITVRRGDRPLEFRLVRQSVTIRPVRYAKQETSAGAIGLIRLSQLSSSAAEEMRAAILDLESQQVEGYILDLRGNAGGLLYASIDIARLWLNEGPIVSLRDRNGIVETHEALGTALTAKPLVVLIDKRTITGGEILAGSLAGTASAISGTTNAGREFDSVGAGLSDGSAIAITVAEWRLPGRETENFTGLTPDIEVSLSAAQQQALDQNRRLIGTAADPQYTAAVAALTALLTEARP